MDTGTDQSTDPARATRGSPPTVPDSVPSLADERRYRALRRLALGGLTAFVALGLAGFLGVRTTVSKGSSGDLDVSLLHPVVARPALAVPYRLTLRREQGFDERIEVRIETRYLQTFDENGTQPQPDAATTDGDETVWEFEPPDGTVFTVWLDTRVEPGVQWHRGGSTTVVHGDEIVTIDHPVWVLP